MQKNRGKFITLEGSEGSGKTTQVELLAQYIRDTHKEKVVCFREPGGTQISEEIRSLFKDKVKSEGMCAETELLLLQASRAQLVREKLVPALNEGITVICDRFFHSTLFYQGFARGLDPELITATTLFATNGLAPDLTLVLTLPLGQAMERIRIRSNLDRLEEETTVFFEKVQLGVEWLAASKSPKVLVVNGDQTVQKVHRDISEGVASRLFPSVIFLPGTYEKKEITQDR